jgi:hypothetical protein
MLADIITLLLAIAKQDYDYQVSFYKDDQLQVTKNSQSSEYLFDFQ